MKQLLYKMYKTTSYITPAPSRQLRQTLSSIFRSRILLSDVPTLQNKAMQVASFQPEHQELAQRMPGH